MSGRIVKAMSLLLCAVLVVGCCLVGCDQDKRPTDYNEITKQDIYDAFKELYPDAELNAEEHEMYLNKYGRYPTNKNGQYPIITNYWLDIEEKAIPDEFGFYFKITNTTREVADTIIVNCYDKTREDIDTVVNLYMSLFYDDWTDDNLSEFSDSYAISYSDSEEEIVFEYDQEYIFHGLHLKMYFSDEDSQISLYPKYY